MKFQKTSILVVAFFVVATLYIVGKASSPTSLRILLGPLNGLQNEAMRVEVVLLCVTCLICIGLHVRYPGSQWFVAIACAGILLWYVAGVVIFSLSG
jgi:hypothetical protein